MAMWATRMSTSPAASPPRRDFQPSRGVSSMSDTPPSSGLGYVRELMPHAWFLMPGYGAQIPTEDRWAIVAWVRALQLTRNATIEDVPADVRATRVTGEQSELLLDTREARYIKRA